MSSQAKHTEETLENQPMQWGFIVLDKGSFLRPAFVLHLTIISVIRARKEPPHLCSLGATCEVDGILVFTSFLE